MAGNLRHSKVGARRAPIAVVGLVATALLVSGCVMPWMQFGGDSLHRSNNTAENTLTLANVNQLKQKWQITLPATADGAPVIANAVATPSGTKDLIVVTTRGGDLVARELSTGAAVWSITFGPGTCHINNGSSVCYTTSSPVIVGTAVYTYGLDGKVHKVTLATGVEVATGGWPVTTTLKPWDEKGSSALSSATAANGHTYLYAVHSGYPGDFGDYQGHLVAIDLADAHTNVFNALCSDQTVLFKPAPATPDCPKTIAGVWARPGTVYDAANDRLYFTTGNADFSPATHQWGDTVLAVHPDGTGANGNPIDTFTPINFQYLDDFDFDLGSVLPAIVPAPAGSTVANIGIQGGKEGRLYVLNLDDLSSQGGPGHTGGELQSFFIPGAGEILPAPAVWTNPADGVSWVFVSSPGHTSAYTLGLDASHKPMLTFRWQNASELSSPFVANGVLYGDGGSAIAAFNPITGATAWIATTGGTHWQSPVVVSGQVITADDSRHLTVYQRP